MPELPEVETIRRQLHDRLAGRTIVRAELLRSGREFPASDAFISGVLEQQVVRVERRAKLLVWRFNNGTSMLGHLKMTGKFLFVAKHTVPGKHDRLRFVFDNGEHVMWSDVRQFGYVKLIANDELERLFSGIGPEPLSTPIDELAARFVRPKTRKIKTALLDQSAIAGVGNIYADEACHRAGIRPTRRIASLTRADRIRLMSEVVQVLQESIAQKGTSANDYIDATGERGGFLALLRVYGRGGEPCRTCSIPIKKIILGGRGTHYCPNCQV